MREKWKEEEIVMPVVWLLWISPICVHFYRVDRLCFQIKSNQIRFKEINWMGRYKRAEVGSWLGFSSPVKLLFTSHQLSKQQQVLCRKENRLSSSASDLAVLPPWLDAGHPLRLTTASSLESGDCAPSSTHTHTQHSTSVLLLCLSAKRTMKSHI